MLYLIMLAVQTCSVSTSELSLLIMMLLSQHTLPVFVLNTKKCVVKLGNVIWLHLGSDIDIDLEKKGKQWHKAFY